MGLCLVIFCWQYHSQPSQIMPLTCPHNRWAWLERRKKKEIFLIIITMQKKERDIHNHNNNAVTCKKNLLLSIL
jgi:hypothetical protein